MTQELTVTEVEEPILEPDIEITDAHHHFGGKSRRDPSREYTLDAFLEDTGSGHRVTNTVFIESSSHLPMDPPSDDPLAPCAPPLAALDELVHVTEIARQSESKGGAVVRGIVGFVDLRHGPAAGEALDRMHEASGGRFVGVRQSSGWDPSPDVRNHKTRPGEGLLAKPHFHAGFAELARRDMSFDAWLYHPQLLDVAALADAFPESRIVVCHLGGPLSTGPYKTERDEVLAVWRRNMGELRRRPNVFIKLGAIGFPMMAEKADVTGDAAVEPTSQQLADFWGDEVRWTVETFGADRCLFESNFPVDGRMCSYAVLWNAFKRMVADASPDEKHALFAGTANRAYALAVGDRS